MTEATMQTKERSEAIGRAQRALKALLGVLTRSCQRVGAVKLDHADARAHDVPVKVLGGYKAQDGRHNA